MTETSPPGPAPGALRAVPLRRRPDDQVLRGVCAAVARTTGTDPVLWRVAVAVLTVFGGSGLLLYVAGWLLIPEEGQERSIGERWLRGRDLQGTTTVVVVVLAALFVAGVGDSDGLVPLAVVGLVAYLLLRRTDATPARTAPAAVPVSRPGAVRLSKDDAPPAWGANAPGPVPWYAAPPPPAEPRPPRPPRPPVVLLTLSALLLVVGGLLVAQAVGADGITAARVLAAGLAVVGAGLVAGAFWRTGKLLLLPAALLGLALVGAAQVDLPLSLSAGDRTWTAVDGGEYRLGAGEAVLDLRDLPAGTPAVVDAELGLGRMEVLVPDGLRVELRAEVGAGEVQLPGEVDPVDGEDLRVTRTYGPEGAPTVVVRTQIGAGELEVRDAA